MKYIVLSVRDVKAGVFSQPFYAPTLQHGIRSFLDAASNPADDNMMRKHPEDFQLYHLGTFEDGSGSFESLATAQLVSSASEIYSSSSAKQASGSGLTDKF
jgi:hypothetical protein